MRPNEGRYTPLPTALCLGILLFTGGAFAQQSAPPVDPPVSELAGTDAIRNKTIVDIPIWKRITVGTYKGVNGMREALDGALMRIGESADEILGRPAFPYSRTKTELDLVVLTAADLGFETGSRSVGEIYRRAMQLGLELCPAEVGPQLRLQYVNQPVGEFLRIAMQPVATYHGELMDLTVANGGTGLLLIGGEATSELQLHSTVKLVFGRPPQIASRDGH